MKWLAQVFTAGQELLYSWRKSNLHNLLRNYLDLLSSFLLRDLPSFLFELFPQITVHLPHFSPPHWSLPCLEHTRLALRCTYSYYLTYFGSLLLGFCKNLELQPSSHPTYPALLFFSRHLAPPPTLCKYAYRCLFSPSRM